MHGYAFLSNESLLTWLLCDIIVYAYGTAQLQGNECSRESRVLHASVTRVTCECHAFYMRASRVKHTSVTHETRQGYWI